MLGFPYSASRWAGVPGFDLVPRQGPLVVESFVYFGYFWVFTGSANAVPLGRGSLLLPDFFKNFTRGAYGSICLDTRLRVLTLRSFSASAVCCDITRNIGVWLPNRLLSLCPQSMDSTTIPELLLKGTFMLPLFAEHLAQPFEMDLGFP